MSAAGRPRRPSQAWAGSSRIRESGLDDGRAVLDAYPPAATERTDTIEGEALHPRRDPVRGDAQGAGIGVGLEPELRAQQEQGRSGGPRLRPRGGGDDAGRLAGAPLVTGEVLRQPVLEVGRAVEERAHDALRLGPPTGLR